jgi:sec-independent protein translocase protein TatB
MFDLGFDKILLLALIIGVVVGPKRLPALASTLGRYVRRLREYVDEKKGELEGELGADFGDLEWRKLDPRQYDPRRIVRDALFDGEPPSSYLEGPPKVGDQEPNPLEPVPGPNKGTERVEGDRDS